MISTDKRTGRVRLRLTGKWLAEYGFTPDAVVVAIPDYGGMSFWLAGYDSGGYPELARYARRHGAQLIQVKKEGRTLCLEVDGRVLAATGLGPEDILVIHRGFGVIQLRALPPKE